MYKAVLNTGGANTRGHIQSESEKMSPFLKVYCFKYEYLIMSFMVCLDGVILPVHLGNIFHLNLFMHD